MPDPLLLWGCCFRVLSNKLLVTRVYNARVCYVSRWPHHVRANEQQLKVIENLLLFFFNISLALSVPAERCPLSNAFFFLMSGWGNINYMAARACAWVYHFFLSHKSRFAVGGTSFGEKSERAIQLPALFFFLSYVCFYTTESYSNALHGDFLSFFHVVSFFRMNFFLQGVVINAGNEWCFLKLPRTFTPLLKSNLLS